MCTGICFVCGKTRGIKADVPWVEIYVDGQAVNAHIVCANEYNRAEARVSARFPILEEDEEEFEQFDLTGREGRPLNFNE